MITTDDLDCVTSALLEHDEVLQIIEQVLFFEDPSDHDLERGHVVRRSLTADSTPRHITLVTSAQAAKACVEAVRDDKDLVGHEQISDSILVGLELIPRPLQPRLLIGGAL